MTRQVFGWSFAGGGEEERRGVENDSSLTRSFFPVADGGNGVGAGKEGEGRTAAATWERWVSCSPYPPLVDTILLLPLVLVFRKGGASASHGDIVPYVHAARGEKEGQDLLPQNCATFALLPKNIY